MRTRLFSGLPTKPVLVLAMAVGIALLAYHYLTTYRECSTHSALRNRLKAAIEQYDSGSAAARVRLADIARFEWDRADIHVNYKPDAATDDCPFGWDWSRKEREALVAKDLLTVVVFSLGGKIVNYLEYPRNWADFAGIENPYTPETAVFDIRRSADRFTFVLTSVSSTRTAASD